MIGKKTGEMISLLRDEKRNAILLEKINLLKIMGRAQDLAIHAFIIPDLDERTRQKFIHESLKLFNIVINSQSEFVSDAYIGKIYALYLNSMTKLAYDVFKEMKDKIGNSNHLAEFLF